MNATILRGWCGSDRSPRRTSRLCSALGSPIRFLAILCGLALASRSAATEPFMLPNGDRVVFLGDSIMEQRLYTTYIRASSVTRFPDWKLRFWNAGWGGDTAWLRMRSPSDEARLFAAAGEEQQKMIGAAVNGPLRRDVLKLEPTIAFVNYGMNDHNYEAFRDDLCQAHVRGQAQICRLVKATGARPILLSPQAIEPRSPQPAADPRNVAIRRFATGAGRVAAEPRGKFLNQFDPYVAIMAREHMRQENASIGGGDEVHPDPPGHLLMAAIILKRLRAPAIVSRVAIDVTEGAVAVTEADRSGVGDLTWADGIPAFDRTDQCLPMPLNERARLALALAPMLHRLDRYDLRVAGLPATATTSSSTASRTRPHRDELKPSGP